MLDFTSALYLGFRHAHNTLRPWAQLTTGRPAALEPAPEARACSTRPGAAACVCERAVLAPSTLHLYWDLFDLLATRPHRDLRRRGDLSDRPLGHRAGGREGRPDGDVFRTHDPAALEYLLHRDRWVGLRPVVVTDGLCPTTGRTAPLPDYLRLVRERDGYLVVDDTQALGILGQAPAQRCPLRPGRRWNSGLVWD